MVNDSPFRAGFGKTPPLLAGRDDVINGFAASIESGAWGPERVTLIEGFRGVGKTVTLNALEDVARSRGWEVLSETATPGFANRLADTHLPRVLDRLNPGPTRRLTGIGAAGVTVDTELVDRPTPPASLRTRLEEVAELLEPRGGGVLITLDEVNTTSAADMRSLAADIQHAIREDREVALVCSGLGAGIAELLSEKSLTFLRRASKVQLDLLSFDDTLLALGEPVRAAGRAIADDVLDYAARATQGYPFLVQLIGDLAWKADPQNQQISMGDARRAFRRARRTMGSHIHEPSLRDLSATDRTVLAAMAGDDGPSRVSDIRARLGLNAQYMGVYRQRLIDSGVIFPAGHGRIDISVPYLRDYLKDHVVTDAVTEIAKRRSSFPPPPELPDQD
jgi:hypothetical protein